MALAGDAAQSDSCVRRYGATDAAAAVGASILPTAASTGGCSGGALPWRRPPAVAATKDCGGPRRQPTVAVGWPARGRCSGGGGGGVGGGSGGGGGEEGTSPLPRVSPPSLAATDATKGVRGGGREGRAPPPPPRTPQPPPTRRRRARQFLRVGVSPCGTALQLQTAVTLYRRRDGVDQGEGRAGGAHPAAVAAATAAATATAATVTPPDEPVAGPPPANERPLSSSGDPHSWLPSRLALVSLLHVAEARYYAALDALLGDASGDGADGGDSRLGVDRATDGSPFAAVFTELVTEPSCLSWDPIRRGYTVSVPLVPTGSCRRLAASVGLVAQLDALPPHLHGGWLVADVRADALRQQVGGVPGDTSPAGTTPGVDAAVGRAAAARRSRATAARLGAALLRAALWLVPLPELALLLTDWASPTVTARRSAAGPGASETPAARAATGASTVTGRSAAGGSVGISPLLPVVVLAAARGDLPGVRRVLFAQTLLAGAAVAAASQPSLTIGARNSAAMAADGFGMDAVGVAWLPAWTLAHGAVAVRWWAAWSALLSDAAGAGAAPAEWRTSLGTHGTAGDAARAAGWADVAAALDTAAPPVEEAAAGCGRATTGAAAAAFPSAPWKAVMGLWPGKRDGRLSEAATLVGLAVAAVVVTALSAADYAATVEGVASLVATAVERAALTTGGAGGGGTCGRPSGLQRRGGGAPVAVPGGAVAWPPPPLLWRPRPWKEAVPSAESLGGGGVLGERVLGELGGYAVRHVLALRLLRAVVLEPLVDQVADV
ncbi:hypothetical protein MMPV_009062 [Pyropia vietnamensis]